MEQAKLVRYTDEDLVYMLQAEQASLLSPDPSMKCGTVLVKNGHVVGRGCNDMPRGCRQDPEVWERPMKYERVVHGEVAAVLDAGDNAHGSIAYCWPPGLGPACSRCASTMIQAGVKTVYYVDKGTFSSPAWNAPVALGNEMFAEAGVELVAIPLEEYNAFHRAD